MAPRSTHLFAPKTTKRVPFDFVLDELRGAEPTTRSMFGSTAVYLEDRILFVLREKGDGDDGVWLAYEPAREPEALAALPRLTAIERLPNVRCWRKLAKGSPHFEQDVIDACRLALQPDSPIGKLPSRLASKKQSAAKASGRLPKAATKRAHKAAGKGADERAHARATNEPSRRSPRAAPRTAPKSGR